MVSKKAKRLSIGQQIAISATLLLPSAIGGGIISIIDPHYNRVFRFVLTLHTVLLASFLGWQPVPHWYPFIICLYTIFVLYGFIVLLLPFFWLNGLIQRRILKRYTYSFALAAKNLGLFTIKCVLALEVGILLYVTLPQSWWLWMSLVYSGYAVLWAYWYPRYLLPHIVSLTPINDIVLCQQFERLCTRAGIKVHDFYVWKRHNTKRHTESSSVANAIVIGLGKMTGIMLTESLLKNFSPAELEIILAHELGHIAHYDMWRKIIDRALFVLVVLSLSSLTRYLVFGPLKNSLLGMLVTIGADSANALWLVALLAIMLIITFALQLLIFYERHLEYLADEYALKLTNDVQGFKSTLLHLADINATSPNVATTHPSLKQRLRHADRYGIKDMLK